MIGAQGGSNAGQKIGQVSEDRRDWLSAFVHEHKLRLKVFPEMGEGPVGVRDLPFAVAETPERYVEGNYWTAVAGRTGGLAFLNRGTMGAVREADEAFSLPLAHAMYYVWETRMLRGRHGYEFALRPFVGEWRQADLHRAWQEVDLSGRPVGTTPGRREFGPWQFRTFVLERKVKAARR